ncbi:MAG: hypothetical protein Q9227_004778 [Pyrenula ochraceoflavens]
MSTNKQSPITILGAGAWGLSTALHLHNAGYTDITVFDRATQIPSPYSAAYDLNKIVRAEYEDPFYTELALVKKMKSKRFRVPQKRAKRSVKKINQEAIKNWKTSLFAPYFHQTGYIVATTGRAPPKATEHLQKALESISSHPVFAKGITALKTPQDFRDAAWQFSEGSLTGFSGYLNRLAGYAHSSDAMRGVWAHLAGRGVRFVLGSERGKVRELLYSGGSTEEVGQGRRCVGVRTADGRTHRAEKVIVALGAWAGSLVPELGSNVVARCWSVAHVQLSKQECDYLRFLPTTNVRDLGFFFEPDPETRLFKLCPLGAGYVNSIESGDGEKVSLPPAGDVPEPQDFIPAEDEVKLRRLLHEVFPWMADRPFVEKRLCWFADSQDSEYCIDFVPDTECSVAVLTGDSGHGFKMMPVFGRWVVDLLKEGRQKESRWKWREHGEEKEWGDEISWRIGKTRDLKELLREKAMLVRARL